MKIIKRWNFTSPNFYYLYSNNCNPLGSFFMLVLIFLRKEFEECQQNIPDYMYKCLTILGFHFNK